MNILTKTPVRRRVADEVAVILREAIFDKIHTDFRPGTQIREVSTAKALGVSRDSLRQALVVLSADGLITISPHRGAYVASVSVPDVREIYKVRRVLELGALEYFNKDISGQLNRLETSLERIRRALATRSLRQIVDADLDFHSNLVSTHGSALITDLYSRVSTKLKLCMAIGHFDSSNGTDATCGSKNDLDDYSAHKQLVGHLRAGETSRAAKLLRRTLADDEARLLQLLEEDPRSQVG